MKKSISKDVVFLVCLVVFLVAGCAPKKQAAQPAQKTVTVVDALGREVTIKQPVERVVTLGGYDAEVICLLGEGDKIVGIADWMPKKNYYKMILPQLTEKTMVGSGQAPNYEKILELKPDLVLCWHYHAAQIAEKLPDSIAVVALDLYDPRTFREEMKKLASILGKEQEAEKYLRDFYDKYANLVESRTKALSDNERPRVYWERLKSYETYGSKNYMTSLIAIAGGKNIFSDSEFDITGVSPEKVVEKNPEIIVRYTSSTDPEVGFGTDRPDKAKMMREELLSRPELATTDAVKNKKVYMYAIDLNLGTLQPVGLLYAAKIFQPDLFKDIDPIAAFRELLREYFGSQFDPTKHGVLVYPPLT